MKTTKEVLLVFTVALLAFISASFIYNQHQTLVCKHSQQINFILLDLYSFNYLETQSVNKKKQLQKAIAKIEKMLKEERCYKKATEEYSCVNNKNNEVLKIYYRLNQIKDEK